MVHFVSRRPINCSHVPQSDYGGFNSWILVLATPPKPKVPSLLQLKNPLPSGSYRIRAFDGPYLLTMPSNGQRQGHKAYVTRRETHAEEAKYQRVSQCSYICIDNRDK